MKLSLETISILQNFSQISPNIIIRPGNKISIRNSTNSIQARATVSETFPSTLPIYDLPQFLNLLSVTKDFTLDFGERSVLIQTQSSEIEYFYAEESLITPVNNDIPEVSKVFTHRLTLQDIMTIIKTSNIISASTLVLKGDGTNVVLLLNDPTNPTSHTFKMVLGESPREFEAKMPVDGLKVIQSEYDFSFVTIQGKKGAVNAFFLETVSPLSVNYIIAADPSTKITV